MNDFDVTVTGLDSVEARIQDMINRLQNPAPVFNKFATHMKGEVSKRAHASQDAEGRPWAGILYSTLWSSNRSEGQKNIGRTKMKRGTKKYAALVSRSGQSAVDSVMSGGKKPTDRVPTSLIHPLQVGNDDLFRTEVGIDAEAGTMRIGPYMDGHGSKFETVLTPHHRPSIMMHAGKGKMPDRSFFYASEKDKEYFIDLLTRSLTAEGQTA